MIDIVGELDRIEYFKRAGVNENGGNEQIDNPPDERFNHLTIYNDSFSPRLPSRPRARTRQGAALPSAAVRLLRGPDRSFPHCNK